MIYIFYSFYFFSFSSNTQFNTIPRQHVHLHFHLHLLLATATTVCPRGTTQGSSRHPRPSAVPRRWRGPRDPHGQVRDGAGSGLRRKLHGGAGPGPSRDMHDDCRTARAQGSSPSPHHRPTKSGPPSTSSSPAFSLTPSGGTTS
jgi:hypothetical protein